MSYEIVYDKQFVKVKENQFIPFILSGSSNCFEWSPSGKDRRSRSWFPYPFNKPLWTKEELVKRAEKIRQDIIDDNNKRERDKWWEEYSDDSFGYWSSIAINGTTHNTTYGQYKGLFVTGCRKALTVEQLRAEHVVVKVSTPYVYDGIEKKYGLKPLSLVAKTGDHLIELLALMEDYLKGTNLSAVCELGGMFDGTPRRLRRKYFPRTPKPKKGTKVKHFWSVGMFYAKGNRPNYYLRRFNSRSVSYSHFPQLKFRTRKEAQKRCDRYAKKLGGYSFILKPHKVEEATVLWK